MRELLKAHLIAEEDKRTHVYRCAANKNTVAVGRNLDDVGLTLDEEKHLGCTVADILAGKALTEEQCDYLLDNDVDRVVGQLDKSLPWWRSRSDFTRVAMASMAFQMGINGLLKFKRMLAALHAGDYETARREGLDSEWAKQTPERAKRVTDLFKP